MRTILFAALCACSLSGALASIAGMFAGSERKVGGLAFAGSVAPTLRASAFLGESSFMSPTARMEIALEEASAQGLSMSCRRNRDDDDDAVKKEKRARNQQMARQYAKPSVGRGRGGRGGGRGGGRAESERQNEADSQWLEQIYGQHTIYRRDNEPRAAAPVKKEAREKVAA